jgi:hypothetical protein
MQPPYGLETALLAYYGVLAVLTGLQLSWFMMAYCTVMVS